MVLPHVKTYSTERPLRLFCNFRVSRWNSCSLSILKRMVLLHMNAFSTETVNNIVSTTVSLIGTAVILAC
jgi:hypothetical protein